MHFAPDYHDMGRRDMLSTMHSSCSSSPHHHQQTFTSVPQAGLGLSFDPHSVHLRQASQALEDLLNRPLMSSAANSPPMVANIWPATVHRSDWSQAASYATSAPTAVDVVPQPTVPYQALMSHISYDCGTGMLSPRSTLGRTPSECGDVGPHNTSVEYFAHATDGWYTVGLATPPSHLHAASATARLDLGHASLLDSAMSSPALLPSSAEVGAMPSEEEEDEDEEDSRASLSRRSSMTEPLDVEDGLLDGPTVEERIRIMEERTKLVRRRQSRMAAGRAAGGRTSWSGRSVAGKAKPICEECQKTFSRKHNLHQHTLRMHNPDRKKTHNCEQCDKTFDRQADLNRHLDSVSACATFADSADRLQIHCAEKKFICELCSTRFPRKDTLRRYVLFRASKVIANDGRHYHQSCVKNLYRRNDKIVRQIQCRPAAYRSAIKLEDI